MPTDSTRLEESINIFMKSLQYRRDIIIAMRFAFTICIAIVLLVPVVAGAQDNGLVPCGYGDNLCTTSHVVAFVAGLIDFLIKMLGVIAVIGLVVAGFRLVISAGKESEWTAAKNMFTNIVIGIVIILAAWLVVDTILRVLTSRGGLNEWSSGLWVTSNTDTSNPDSDDNDNNDQSSGCPTCVQVQGVGCKNAQSCSVTPEYAARLQNLSGAGIEITEAWPPTRTHQAACHSNGTCTDVVFADRNFTPARVQQFQAQARQAGFRAVYEPPAGVSCAGYTNCLPYSTTRSTGHHFSLYMQ